MRVSPLLWLTLVLPFPALAAPPPSTPFEQVSATTWLGGALGVPLADAIAALETLGITTVIDLRGPSEDGVAAEGAALRAAGLRYVNFPTDGTLPDAARRAEFDEVLRETEAEPRLLHCASGNRAALSWALHRLDAGVPLDAVMSEVRLVLTKPPLVELVKTHATELAPTNQCTSPAC